MSEEQALRLCKACNDGSPEHLAVVRIRTVPRVNNRLAFGAGQVECGYCGHALPVLQKVEVVMDLEEFTVAKVTLAAAVDVDVQAVAEPMCATCKGHPASTFIGTAFVVLGAVVPVHVPVCEPCAMRHHETQAQIRALYSPESPLPVAVERAE